MLLIPLAVTSTHTMMRRLGRRWQLLHRLIYLIGLLGVTHYLWLVSAAVLALLLVMRLPWGVALLRTARNRFVQDRN